MKETSSKPKLLIFATGEKTPGDGGSGFKNLVLASRAGILDAEIVGVVSNYPSGGVFTKAAELGIPFCHMPVTKEMLSTFLASEYVRIVNTFGADFVALSGWLRMVYGLDSSRTINIHPGPIPGFGGTGFFGHHVHDAVIKARDEWGLRNTAVCMHFVTGVVDDERQLIARVPVQIRGDDTAKILGSRVLETEHLIQPLVTNLVLNGQISWSGVKGEPVVFPKDYDLLHPMEEILKGSDKETK